MNRDSVNRFVVLLLVLFISAIFLSMIRQFLMAIFLAGIFSALAHPLYSRFEQWFKGRRVLASLTTLLILVLLVLLPLAGLMGIVTAQAIKVGESVTPWIQKQLSEPVAISRFLQDIPFFDAIVPYRDLILQKAGEVVGSISGFLISSVSSFTIGTVNFLFMTFILLYTMFFFLMDGDKLLAKILYYLPLKDQDERRMLEKFTAVTRSILKGTAMIGILQGSLAGLAFAVMGIGNAVFWGTIMTVLSIIPSIGSALVWGPAAIIMAVGGHYAKAVGLVIFCGLVVGSLDNFLRPRLVGRDTQMHDLLILFATMGGLFMFGILGFIIGPIVAALFVTIWEIYGTVFQEYLPKVDVLHSGSRQQKTKAENPAEDEEAK